MTAKSGVPSRSPRRSKLGGRKARCTPGQRVRNDGTTAANKAIAAKCDKATASRPQRQEWVNAATLHWGPVIRASGYELQ